MTPRVSVVVPTFNGERHIASTLDAVAAQTLPGGVELIVVDDGSGDRTLETVLRAAPHARVLRQRNAGVSAARNAGLALASAPFVIFLDQDDLWHPRQLELQVAWLDASPRCGAVACPFEFWRPAEGEPVPTWPAAPDQPEVDFEGWSYRRFLVDCWALTSATLLRTSIVREAGGFDEGREYGEDWDLWLRLSRRVPFALLRAPSALYRQHPVQGSRRVRNTDVRVALLEEHATRCGLSEPDGQALDPSRFRSVLASYGAEFGYHHLARGHRWVGVAALWRAWRREPWKTRRFALMVAGALGWRPKGLE